MKHPLITIGLTTYNAEETVVRALQSALSQTWGPIEIVAVDDCSRDRTYQTLLEAAEDHPEIRVYQNKKNSGVAVSRNHIIDKAKGEFLVFFDDDDESISDRITIQLDRILKYEEKFANSAPVICHAARHVLYPDGRRHIEKTMGENEGAVAPNGLAVAKRILIGEPLKNAYGACPTCSQMARLSVYKKFGSFDPELRRSEDTEFNIRLAKEGAHFVGVSQPLVIQKMTKTTDKNLDDEYHYMARVMDKHSSIMQGKLEFCKRWLALKHDFLKGQKREFAFNFMKLVMIYPLQTYHRLVSSFPSININKRFHDFHKTGA